MRTSARIKLQLGAFGGLLSYTLGVGLARAAGPAEPVGYERYRTPIADSSAYWHSFATLALGDGLRFNNPYRLSTPLGKTPESVSLTAAYYDLGLVFQNQGRNGDAETQYHIVLTMKPTYAPALYNLAILRAAANDTAGATSLYRQAIASSPDFANAHFNLGLLLRKAGQKTEGDNEIRQAVKLDKSLAAKAAAQGVNTTATTTAGG